MRTNPYFFQEHLTYLYEAHRAFANLFRGQYEIPRLCQDLPQITTGEAVEMMKEMRKKGIENLFELAPDQEIVMAGYYARECREEQDNGKALNFFITSQLLFVDAAAKNFVRDVEEMELLSQKELLHAQEKLQEYGEMFCAYSSPVGRRFVDVEEMVKGYETFIRSLCVTLGKRRSA